MIEGGTGHDKGINDQLVGCPLDTYIKDGGRRRLALIGRAQSVEFY